MASRLRLFDVKKVNTNTIVAIAALVTSVVAVFIAWDEGRLQRQSQRASFLPLIALEGSFSTSEDEMSVTVSATNRGHGVAFLESFEVFVGEERIESWTDFSEGVLSEELAASVDFSWANPEGFFQPGDRKELIKLVWPADQGDAYREHFFGGGRAKIDAFEATACYCSVFGECWTSPLNGEIRPLQVRSCPDGDDIIGTLWRGFLDARLEARDDG